MSWILGYNGACGTCKLLATEIAAIAGDRLEIKSLHNPEVQKWRQSLGMTSFAPTLFKVEGDIVMTGYQNIGFNWHMLRLLGFRDAVRVLEIFNNVTNNSSHVANPSRRRVLRRATSIAGGTALALGLAGIPTANVMAAAPKDDGRRKAFPFDQLVRLNPNEKPKELTDQEQNQRQTLFMRGSHLQSALSEHGIDLSNARERTMAEHRLVGGNTLHAASWTFGNLVLAFYSLDRPVDGAHSFAALHHISGTGKNTTAHLVAAYRNGKPLTRRTTNITPDMSLDPCGDCLFGGEDSLLLCDNFSIWNIIINCGWCVATCLPAPWVCAGCLAVMCPWQFYSSCESGWYWGCGC